MSASFGAGITRSLITQVISVMLGLFFGEITLMILETLRVWRPLRVIIAAAVHTTISFTAGAMLSVMLFNLPDLLLYNPITSAIVGIIVTTQHYNREIPISTSFAW